MLSVSAGVDRPSGPAWLPAALPVLLALATIAVYWPATGHEFLNYDDPDYITANVHVQGGLTPDNLNWAFTHPVGSNWHPLTILSHMADCQLYGLKPRGHHLTSVLLHAANTALVFLLFRRLTGATWRSWLAAALFGLHPLHVESVAWVAERKDVLSAFFGLLTLLCYARAMTDNGWQAARTDPSPSRVPCHESPFYWLALFFFALGLMCKPMLVTLPFVLLLLDYWPLQRGSKVESRGSRETAMPDSRPSALGRLLLEKAPFFLLAAAVGVTTYLVQQHSGSVQSTEMFPPMVRVENALISYCRYLEKFFWPTDLAVFYPYPGHWPPAAVLAAGALLAGITALAFLERARRPYLLLGWLWFCGMLVPVIGLVQVGRQSMADRYTYLPSLGLSLLVVWGIYDLLRGRRYHRMALGALGGAAVFLCLGLTCRQLGYWQNNETLYRHALAVTQNNYLAHHNLGIALYRQGRVPEAIDQYREAIRVEPGEAEAHYDLGAALGVQKQTDEAINQFQEALRLKPDYPEAHSNLGTALALKGRLDEAMVEYQEAVRLKPDQAELHYELGTVLGMKGRIDEAIGEFQEALRLKPDFVAAQRNLAHARQLKNAL